jgi:hypothetical protein
MGFACEKDRWIAFFDPYDAESKRDQYNYAGNLAPRL